MPVISITVVVVHYRAIMCMDSTGDILFLCILQELFSTNIKKDLFLEYSG
jgi:hypothetical protein